MGLWDAPTARHRASPRYALRRRDLSHDRPAVRQGQSRIPRNRQYHAARVSCERLHQKPLDCKELSSYIVNNTRSHTHIIHLSTSYIILHIVYIHILHTTLFIVG